LSPTAQVTQVLRALPQMSIKFLTWFPVSYMSKSRSTCAIYYTRVVLFSIDFWLLLVIIPYLIPIHIDFINSMICLNFIQIICHLMLRHWIFISWWNFLNMIIVISILRVFSLWFCIFMNFLYYTLVFVLKLSDNFVHLVKLVMHGVQAYFVLTLKSLYIWIFSISHLVATWRWSI